MFVMIFLIGANYNLLKILKDSVLVSMAGAEALPFVKVWFLLPSAVILSATYVKLSQLMSPNKVFYSFILFFYSFYLVFFLWIFPNREALYIHDTANFIQSFMPKGAKGLVESIRYWPLVLFYPFCELWGTMIQFVLFWGFVNRVTKIDQAKRFYPLFGLATNLSGTLAPVIFIIISKFNEKIDNIMGVVILFLSFNVAIILLMFRHATKNLEGENTLEVLDKKTLNIKKKIPLIKAFKNLFENAYVRNLTIIVLAYNICINLTEIIWKEQMKSMHTDMVKYAVYFAQVAFITGVIASISDLFICGPVVRKWGLGKAAMVTPIVITITSVGFFPLLLFPKYTSFVANFVGVTPIALIVFIGSMQNILSRGCKYSFFDTTKEMAFIPMNIETKTMAKATIDGVGSRLGKSMSSFGYQVIFVGLGGLAASIPIATGIIGFVLVSWTKSAKSLGIKFNNLSIKNDDTRLKADQLSAQNILIASAQENILNKKV